MKTKLLEKLEDYLLKFQHEFKETEDSLSDSIGPSDIGNMPDSVHTLPSATGAHMVFALLSIYSSWLSLLILESMFSQNLLASWIAISVNCVVVAVVVIHVAMRVNMPIWNCQFRCIL